MKIRKFDCIGRVPSSISDLDKCDICLNETVCMSMQGVVTQSMIQEAEEKYKVSDSCVVENQNEYMFK